MSMALKKLPEAFSFEAEEKKGVFPFKFSSLEPEKYNFVGPLPNLEFYSLSSMKPKELSEFMEWYEKAKSENYVFDHRKEILSYCQSDVRILAKASLVFSKLMIEMCDFNPLVSSITLPDACMTIFRKSFLIENTQFIEKNVFKGNQSFICRKFICFLKFFSEAKPEEVIPEMILPDCNLRVDAFKQNYDPISLKPTEKIVYQFNGCWYHLCNCVSDSFLRKKQIKITKYYPHLNLKERIEQTEVTNKRLRQNGYTLATVKECEFRKFLKMNPHIDDALNKHDFIKYADNLNFSSAKFGGRTEVGASYLSCESNPNLRIRYLDFISLYGSCMLSYPFPIGAPTCRLKYDECKAYDFFSKAGLVKALVLPPQDLHWPILPAKINNLLMFTLCYTCASEQNVMRTCLHPPLARALCGTWTILEMREALKFGYKILYCIEIVEFEMDRTDDEAKFNTKEGLFSKYQKVFLKIKLQNSGLPRKNMTEKEIENYVTDIEKKYGILLEKNKITKNKALANLSKRCANSFFGKLLMRPIQTHNEILNDFKEVEPYLNSNLIEIDDSFPLPNDKLMIVYKMKSSKNNKKNNNNPFKDNFSNEAEIINKYSNVVCGCYITAYARLKLFRVINSLGKSVGYLDTDSCIYLEDTSDKNRYIPPIGDGFGELKDELEEFSLPDDRAYIDSFVSIGSKTYSFRVKREKSDFVSFVSRHKGFASTHKTSKFLNFLSFKKIILGTDFKTDNEIDNDGLLLNSMDGVEIEEEERIKRQKYFKLITETNFKKKLQFTNMKRVLLQDYSTLPFGHKDIPNLD